MKAAAAFACAALLLVAAPAGARVPRAFVGMNIDGPALDAGTNVERELRRIAGAGARSVRWAVYWPAMQPYRSWAEVPPDQRQAFEDVDGVPTDFRATDRFVGAAARAGLEPLPVVMSAAPWAAENPALAFSPPIDTEAFGRFAGTLARRYGRGGAFWHMRPRSVRRPVRAWQIWNEPAGSVGFGSQTVFWNSDRDQLRGYIAMLTAAHRELRAADPRARVVLSGFFGQSWTSVEQLYAAGAGDLFDVVAVHPYTRRPRNVMRILHFCRDVMDRHGDRDKPLIVTELSWPSADGIVRRPFPFGVSKRGQARALARAFRLLARERRRLRLRAAYWYTWMSRDTSRTATFDHAGLLTRTADGGVRRKPALRKFRRVARQLYARAPDSS